MSIKISYVKTSDDFYLLFLQEQIKGIIIGEQSL